MVMFGKSRQLTQRFFICTNSLIPIFKNKGDLIDQGNYRDITLVSTLGKIFTKMINDRLERFPNTNDISKDNQAGFRKGHSTIDQIFVLQSLIDICISKNDKIYVAWVDYSKAFDTVWRKGLWYKMLKEGISGKLVRIVKHMYDKIKSKVLFL